MKTLNLVHKILRPVVPDVCSPAGSATCLEILTAVFSTKKYDGFPIDAIRKSQKKMRGERVSRIVWVKTDTPGGMNSSSCSGKSVATSDESIHLTYLPNTN